MLLVLSETTPKRSVAKSPRTGASFTAIGRDRDRDGPRPCVGDVQRPAFQIPSIFRQ